LFYRPRIQRKFSRARLDQPFYVDGVQIGPCVIFRIRLAQYMAFGPNPDSLSIALPSEAVGTSVNCAVKAN